MDSEDKPEADRTGGGGRSGQGGMRPFARSLPMLLMIARETVMQRFRPVLQRHGVTDQQWRILRALAEADSLEISTLGHRCAIHPASLSRILPKLEAQGRLSRRTHETDKRRVSVALTPAGRVLFDEIAPESERVYARIAAEIGPERMREAYDMLDGLIERLSRDSR